MLLWCAVMEPYLDHHSRKAPVATARCFLEASVPLAPLVNDTNFNSLLAVRGLSSAK